MDYKLENEVLKVIVNSHGAEITNVVYKETGEECIWQADPTIWARHAPILFPYTGKLTGGEFTHKGKSYKGGQHGFARDSEFDLVSQSDDELVLELKSNEETLKKFPFDFVLKVKVIIEGNTVDQVLEVENPSDEVLKFGIGYHPAFICPFDDKHETRDYEFRFNEEESPLVVDARPNGLLSGKNYYLGSNINKVQLRDDLFSNDSFCMVNLKSTKLGIYEKDSDRSVECDITGYPYTLIWSQLTKKIKFVCIEPWRSLTGPEDGSKEWEDRPAAASLKKGEAYSTSLKMTFNR